MLQNMMLVLLATAFCFVLGLLYCLSKPDLYEAIVDVAIKTSDNRALDETTRNGVISLLFSQSVHEHMADFSDKYNDLEKFENFYRSLSVKENKDHLVIGVANQNATYAQLILESFVTAFRKELAETYPDDLQIITASRSKRNSLLNNVLNNFDRSLQNGEYENGSNSLYASLVAAIGKRIAYDASIAVLQNLRNSHQSPLNLDFIGNDPTVVKTSGDYAKLTSEIAHMKTQLGRDHPQVKAMIAEQTALATELDNKINLAINRLYTEADLAQKIENGLRDELNKADVQDQRFHNEALVELEKKLKSIWDDYDRTIEKAGILKGNNIVVGVSPIKVEKQSVFARFGAPLSLTTLSAFLFFSIFSLFSKKCRLTKLDKAENHEKTNIEKSKPAVTDGEQLSLHLDQMVAKLKQINAKLVSVAGQNAARASARLSMSVKHDGTSILLVDMSTNEIGNLIGPHRGFTDVLTGEAEISEVIYSDYDTGIDILPQGIASMFRAKDFLKNIPALIDSLKNKYSLILVAMTVEPEFGVEEIFTQSDCLIISTNDTSDEHKWHDLFSNYSDNLVLTFTDNE